VNGALRPNPDGLRPAQEPPRPRPVWPAWFTGAAVLVPALAAGGVQSRWLLLVALLLVLATCRDLWQIVLLLLLTSLTIATAAPDAIGIEQPFLLRFILASALALLTVALHPLRGRLPDRVRLHTQGLIVFLLAASIGTATAVLFRLALEGLAATAVTLGIPVLAAAARWRRTERLLNDLSVIYRFLMLVVLIGLGTAASVGFSGRAAGLHANANTYAFMAVLAYGLDLGLRSRMPRPIASLTLPALVLAVGASGSRGALLGVLIAPAYLLLRRRARGRAARVAVTLLLGTAFLVAFPIEGPLDVRAVYERTFGSEELDLSGRQDAWDNMLRLSAERPILGHGLRTTSDLIGERRGTAEFTSSLGGHSSYLTVLVETGWVGAILLFGTVAFALLAPAPQGRDETAAWIAASGVVVAGAGHMIGESFVLGVGSPFPIVFWSAATALALLGSRRRDVVQHWSSNRTALRSR
jgi:O-antigen ligase